MILLAILAVQSAQTLACEKEYCVLPKDYDRKVRPSAGTGGPSNLSFQLYIESFSSLDVSKMEFTAYGYMIQRWTDDRLANLNNTPIILESHDATSVWLPDIFCVECRSSNLASGINLQTSMVRIMENGSIYFSTGVTLVGSCHVDLRRFPFDKQNCSLNFCSYSYNMSYINYTLHDQPYVKAVELDQYVVSAVNGYTSVADYNQHDFLIINAQFTFERRVGYYILQLYIPTAMLVLLSWGMLCLGQESSGDRITVGLTLFLTMIFLQGYANTSLPRVSYVKSIDLFMFVSLMEILLILIESIVVSNLYMRRNKKDEKRRLSEAMSQQSLIAKREQIENNMGLADRNDNNGAVLRKSKTAINHEQVFEMEMPDMEPRKSEERNGKDLQRLLSHRKSVASKRSRCTHPLDVWIEKCCTVLLPLSYVLFNGWYWGIHVSSPLT